MYPTTSIPTVVTSFLLFTLPLLTLPSLQLWCFSFSWHFICFHLLLCKWQFNCFHQSHFNCQFSAVLKFQTPSAITLQKILQALFVLQIHLLLQPQFALSISDANNLHFDPLLVSTPEIFSKSERLSFQIFFFFLPQRSFLVMDVQKHTSLKSLQRKWIRSY